MKKLLLSLSLISFAAQAMVVDENTPLLHRATSGNDSAIGINIQTPDQLETPDQSNQVLFLEGLTPELKSLLSENSKKSKPTVSEEFFSFLCENKKRDSDCSHHDFNPLYFCILPLKEMTSQELTSLKKQLRERVKRLENTKYSLNNFRIMPKTDAYQEMAKKATQICRKADHKAHFRGIYKRIAVVSLLVFAIPVTYFELYS